MSFSGQDQLPATVVGKDRSTDIAVLKIDAHARALTPLPLGNSDAATVGDAVYAIGNPFGLTRTLTTGVVSAVQRQIFAPNGVPIDSAIQTDAAINHGNSGGPLIDAAGRVIGVTSQIQTGSDQNQGNVGIGFAIPVNTVRDIAGQIIASGKAEHAFLGLSAAAVTPQLQRLFNLPTSSGLLVRDVSKGSGAAKAGIKGGTTSVVVEGESYKVGGDIITKVDGRPVRTYDQLYAAVQRKSPGDSVKIELYHDNSKRTRHRQTGNTSRPVAEAEGRPEPVLPARARPAFQFGCGARPRSVATLCRWSAGTSSSSTRSSRRKRSSGRTTTAITTAGSASGPTRFRAPPTGAPSSRSS